MSILCYRDPSGKDITIREPTEEDYAAFWLVFFRRWGTKIDKVVAKNFASNNPDLSPYAK